MKICFIAPSGYGKSTAVKYLEENYGACNIKIADFLYEIQNYIYMRMGIDINEKQDGELLQFLGNKVRKINSSFLLLEFERKVTTLSNELILNDDCRPYDYEYLKSLGFIFVRIDGISHEREDITKINKKSHLEWNEMPNCDYVLKNTSSLEEYYKNIDKLMGVIKCERQVLCYTGSKGV